MQVEPMVRAHASIYLPPSFPLRLPDFHYVSGGTSGRGAETEYLTCAIETRLSAFQKDWGAEEGKVSPSLLSRAVPSRNLLVR